MHEKKLKNYANRYALEKVQSMLIICTQIPKYAQYMHVKK